ncbi:MAG: GTPase HflX [Clostridiales bacterium]|nr:GTPase HflX [Clostridiales bacterium]
MRQDPFEQRTKTALAALFLDDRAERAQQMSLEELAGLVETAGGEVLGAVTQARDAPDPRTFLGTGKLDELRDFARANEVELIVFDNELSPSQIKNIEERTDCRVFDRSMLILEIFDLHATTWEGKIQVEMAQLRYTLPRLTGKGIELSRLGGGGGMGARRGKGETRLELQRRQARDRIAVLRRELADLQRSRRERRRQRDRAPTAKVVLVGYTNAGKSTLLNTLTGAGVLVEDKLFATLDPTTRRMTAPDGTALLLTDTVGFISHLPHHLVEAFASTLEEVTYADLLLHVVDVGNPDCERQMEVCLQQIAALGAGHLSVVTALNKADLCAPEALPYVPRSVPISAKSGEGIDALLSLVLQVLAERQRVVEVLLPYEQSGLAQQMHALGQVLEQDYRADGIFLRVRGDDRVIGRVSDYRI